MSSPKCTKCGEFKYVKSLTGKKFSFGCVRCESRKPTTLKSPRGRQVIVLSRFQKVS